MSLLQENTQFKVPVKQNNMFSLFLVVMESHITWMLFAIHTTYSEFCKDDLMMVNWPKHVVKIRIKTYIVVSDWNLKLFVVF